MDHFLIILLRVRGNSKKFEIEVQMLRATTELLRTARSHRKLANGSARVMFASSYRSAMRARSSLPSSLLPTVSGDSSAPWSRSLAVLAVAAASSVASLYLFSGSAFALEAESPPVYRGNEDPEVYRARRERELRTTSRGHRADEVARGDPDADLEEFRHVVAVVGITGSGKSSTSNTMLTRGKMARSFYDVIADSNRSGKEEGSASVEAVMNMGRAAADAVASAATSLTGSGKVKDIDDKEEEEGEGKKKKKKLKKKRTKVDASVAQGKAMRHGWDKAVVGTADNALRREKEFDAPRRNRKFRTSQSLTSETRSVSHRDYVSLSSPVFDCLLCKCTVYV